MNKFDRSPRYQAFVLRIWEERTPAASQWRFSLEELQSGKRYGFADLSALVYFLRTQLSLNVEA